jgi:hypothetical protein
MSTKSHHSLTARLRQLVSMALLAMLVLVGWHVSGVYAVCDPLDPDCPFPPPQPKKDFYCAYPVLTFMKITDAHESGVTGPWAYMFFASAGASKTGSYADYLGTGLSTPLSAPLQTQHNYNNNAWASNFKGPRAIDGESSRRQWEWNDPQVEFYGHQTASWGPGGTPYKYGKVCHAVNVGGTHPGLSDKTEDVYEDDEFINPDDYVGGFRIHRHQCEADVWSRGYATGWTNEYFADVWGDIDQIRYKLWCYACTNTTSCATGVGPDRGPGY